MVSRRRCGSERRGFAAAVSYELHGGFLGLLLPAGMLYMCRFGFMGLVSQDAAADGGHPCHRRLLRIAPAMSCGFSTRIRNSPKARPRFVSDSPAATSFTVRSARARAAA